MMLSYIQTGRIDLGGVRIYKRKQESKKRRKHALDQESDQEKKRKKERKHALDQERDQEKKKNR